MMSKGQQLLRRLENNPSSYRKLAIAYKKRESAADKTELFQYLSDISTELEREDFELMFSFKDPLAAVADLWNQHQAMLGGHDDV